MGAQTGFCCQPQLIPIFAFMKPTKPDGGFKAYRRLVPVLLALTLVACKPKSYEPASDAGRTAAFYRDPADPRRRQRPFRGCHRQGGDRFRPAVLRRTHRQHPGIQWLGRGCLRLRQRRVHGSLLRQPGTVGGRDPRGAGNPPPAQPALSQQSRRHVHRRDGEGGSRRQGIRNCGRRGRLRRRRLDGPLCRQRRQEHPLPQQWRRHVHRRDRQGRGGRPEGRESAPPGWM